MATIKQSMSRPINADIKGVKAVVNEAVDGIQAVPTELVIKAADDSTFKQITDEFPMPTKLTGSNVTLADAVTTTGRKTAIPVGWYSMLRVNVFGTGTFSVQVQVQTYDGVWRALTPSDALTGVDATTPITTAGVYDFDIAAFQQVAANIASVSGGNVSVKGALLP